jgi:predicted esterase
VLFGAIVPFEPAEQVALGGTRVFLGAGKRDPVVPPPETERLARLLRRMGAEVTLHWSGGGHEIEPAAVAGAHSWLGLTR